MKHLIASAVVILVVGTGLVLFKIDFYYGNFNEEIKSLYALFLGFICTAILVISMSIIYKRNSKQEISESKEIDSPEQEEMNEIYRHKESFPLGCMGFVVGFVALIAYILYVRIIYL